MLYVLLDLHMRLYWFFFFFSHTARRVDSTAAGATLSAVHAAGVPTTANAPATAVSTDAPTGQQHSTSPYTAYPSQSTNGVTPHPAAN